MLVTRLPPRSQSAFAAILIGLCLSARASTSLADTPPNQQGPTSAVRQATHFEPVNVGRAAQASPPLALPGASSHDATKSSGFGFEAILSLLFSVALVVGVFYGVAWFMRRSLPPAARRLPGDVVEVLGRAPLAGRQQMQLVRLGAKLLLISVSTDGATCLSEITDAAEVDRMITLCRETRRAPRTGKTKTAEVDNA